MKAENRDGSFRCEEQEGKCSFATSPAWSWGWTMGFPS